MAGLAVKISEEFVAKSATPTKQAWAAYVRRRWRENAVSHVQAEWDLTPGEARGLVYGSVSQNTLDKIAQHPRGGLEIEFCVIAQRWGFPSAYDLLEAFVAFAKRKHADEERQARENADRLERMGRHLPAVLGLAGPVAVGERVRSYRDTAAPGRRVVRRSDGRASG